MPKTDETHDPIEQLCKDKKAALPIDFLVEVMRGNDPRVQSNLHHLVVDIKKARRGKPPTQKQWEALLDIVEAEHTHRPVPIELSERVARTLVEYQHSKKSAMKIDASVSGVGASKVTPLTTAEIKRFKKTFGDLY